MRLPPRAEYAACVIASAFALAACSRSTVVTRKTLRNAIRTALVPRAIRADKRRGSRRVAVNKVGKIQKCTHLPVLPNRVIRTRTLRPMATRTSTTLIAAATTTKDKNPCLQAE